MIMIMIIILIMTMMTMIVMMIMIVEYLKLEGKWSVIILNRRFISCA